MNVIHYKRPLHSNRSATIARFGGEVWLSYNPESPESATHLRFVKNPTDRTIICTVNWNDNPWHNERMERERLNDLRDRPDLYHHIWEGEFLTMTEAQVFAGKFRQEDMEAPPNSTPYFGLDFGFSTDPACCVRVYKIGRVLLWRNEFYKRGVLINQLGGEIRKGVGDDVARYDVIADSSRPDDIAYLKQPVSVSGGSFQLPRIKGSVKGQGSFVVDDIHDAPMTYHHTLGEYVFNMTIDMVDGKPDWSSAKLTGV